MMNIRDLSIRCGRCLNFMTLASYAPRDGWNAYTYECETAGCDAGGGRTIVEVPAEQDEFAQKHPACGGGCSLR
jgi:hypothetical protein